MLYAFLPILRQILQSGAIICIYLPTTYLPTLKLQISSRANWKRDLWVSSCLFFIRSNIQRTAMGVKKNLFCILYFIRLFSKRKLLSGLVYLAPPPITSLQHTHSSLSPFPGFPAPLSPSSQSFGWSRWPLPQRRGSSGWLQSCSPLTTHPSWPDMLSWCLGIPDDGPFLCRRAPVFSALCEHRWRCFLCPRLDGTLQESILTDRLQKYGDKYWKILWP